MELRGHRRAKKPQSGFFSRHYISTTFRRKQGKQPPFDFLSPFSHGKAKILNAKIFPLKFVHYE